MSRSRLISNITQKLATPPPSSSTRYENIIPLIDQDKVIPIISNSFRVEQIFAADSGEDESLPDAAVSDEEQYTSDEIITTQWAESIGYPMPDKNDVARVAQYHLVEESKEGVSSFLAKTRYIDFMKKCVLAAFEDDEEKKTKVKDLKAKAASKGFSQIVSDLELPTFPPNRDDPLQLLASMPLSTYLTTSYYDFMERALVDAGRPPQTQVCFWSGQISGVKPEHELDHKFVPTVGKPVVYHLYGLEDYASTVVLSEDDYMNFLISVMSDTNSSHPLIPFGITNKLPESKLLLLGYQLRDWDFRVLFRLLAKFRSNKNSQERGMVIQLKEPDKKEMGDMNKTIEYLKEYFNQENFEVNFEVKWKNVDDFIRELYAEWCRQVAR